MPLVKEEHALVPVSVVVVHIEVVYLPDVGVLQIAHPLTAPVEVLHVADPVYPLAHVHIVEEAPPVQVYPVLVVQATVADAVHPPRTPLVYVTVPEYPAAQVQADPSVPVYPVALEQARQVALLLAGAYFPVAHTVHPPFFFHDNKILIKI